MEKNLLFTYCMAEHCLLIQMLIMVHFFGEITNNISKYMLNEKYNKVHKN